MSRAEELQAAVDALNVQMVAKLGLDPGDNWTNAIAGSVRRVPGSPTTG